MREYQRKIKIKKYLYSRPAVVILLIIAALLARSAWNVFQKKIQSDRNASQAEIELYDLQNRQKALSYDVDRLRTGIGVEEEIRQKFNVAKEGEKVIIIVDDKEGTTTPSQEQNFIERIWSAITGWFRFE